MPRPLHNTTGLPRQLREELGLKDSYGEKKRRNAPVSRKDRRRDERSSKSHRGGQNRRDQEGDEYEGGEYGSGLDSESVGSEVEQVNNKQAKSKSKSTKSEKKPKSILKKPPPAEEPDSASEDEEEVRPRKISKTVQSKLDEDDAEIAALEKKLGMKKGKKLPKAFADDGLGDLLGDLGDGSGDETKKRKRDADEWLRNKRRKAQGLGDDESDDESDGESQDASELEDEDMDGLEDMDDLSEGSDEDDGPGETEDSEFEGFDEEQPAPKKRENPYVAPVPAPSEQPAKYIPPSLRAASGSESESLTRLRRQAQGQLNKLSESNLVSILAEFEKLYREYPRQHVTSTVISLLMGLICERSALQDTFHILHGGFIAALYKVIGMDFGAELVQKVVETFDAGGDERGTFQGKEAINLMALLSQLYNFHVVGSPLVFDYIRLFLQEITEANTELLLKIIKNSGPQLRQDDPSALKDIVLLIQPAVAKAGEASLSVRTKFMIDTINDLKNNRLKSNVNSSVSSEHITKMRKILGSLNNSRAIRGAEPISISREDIHNSAKKGKWWLIGASWKADPLESARKELSNLPVDQATAIQQEDSEGEPDLVNIAKAQRMNTDVRRSIFVAIMSATDFQDAYVRLMKLRLKRAQEYEIPRVLVHCTMGEEAHNPYYTLIARRLCGDMGRRIKVSFMYALWNIFRKMGERTHLDEDEDDADEEDEETSLPMKSLVNLAKMYASLIADNTLTLSILKNLNFAYLRPKTKTFVELLVISIIQQSQRLAAKKRKKSKKNKKTEDADNEDDEEDEKAVMEIFLRTRDTPHIVKGLMYFLRKVVAKTDIVPSDEEARVVKWGVRVATDALRAVSNEEVGA